MNIFDGVNDELALEQARVAIVDCMNSIEQKVLRVSFVTRQTMSGVYEQGLTPAMAQRELQQLRSDAADLWRKIGEYQRTLAQGADACRPMLERARENAVRWQQIIESHTEIFEQQQAALREAERAAARAVAQNAQTAAPNIVRAAQGGVGIDVPTGGPGQAPVAQNAAAVQGEVGAAEGSAESAVAQGESSASSVMQSLRNAGESLRNAGRAAASSLESNAGAIESEVEVIAPEVETVGPAVIGGAAATDAASGGAVAAALTSPAGLLVIAAVIIGCGGFVVYRHYHPTPTSRAAITRPAPQAGLSTPGGDSGDASSQGSSDTADTSVQPPSVDGTYDLALTNETGCEGSSASIDVTQSGSALTISAAGGTLSGSLRGDDSFSASGTLNDDQSTPISLSGVFVPSGDSVAIRSGVLNQGGSCRANFTGQKQ